MYKLRRKTYKLRRKIENVCCCVRLLLVVKKIFLLLKTIFFHKKDLLFEKNVYICRRKETKHINNVEDYEDKDFYAIDNAVRCCMERNGR